MDLREFLFRIRGLTPAPFLLASLIWANPDPVLILAGAILCIIGELLRIQAIRHAGGATRTRNVGAPGLVTSGPYARVRNPLYLANMLIYTGYALASGALMPYLPVVTFVFFAIQYGMIISLEEVTLTKLFGEEYQRYCRRVPRLFPLFGMRMENRDPAKYGLGEALREERSTLMGLISSWIILALRMAIFPPVQ